MGLLFNRLSSGTVKTPKKLGNQCFLYNYNNEIGVSIYNSKYDGFTRHWNTIFMGTMMNTTVPQLRSEIVNVIQVKYEQHVLFYKYREEIFKRFNHKPASCI